MANSNGSHFKQLSPNLLALCSKVAKVFSIRSLNTESRRSDMMPSAIWQAMHAQKAIFIAGGSKPAEAGCSAFGEPSPASCHDSLRHKTEQLYDAHSFSSRLEGRVEAEQPWLWRRSWMTLEAAQSPEIERASEFEKMRRDHHCHLSLRP